MSDNISVGIADMKVSRSPGVIVTYALGSCVGICLYDRNTKVGGLGHIMLPTYPPGVKDGENKYKFADTCVPIMIQEMQRIGGMKSRLVAKIAGGAKMFNVVGDASFGNIGERNVAMVRQALRNFGIPIIAEDVGLNYGRTVFFDVASGEMTVKSFSQGVKVF